MIMGLLVEPIRASFEISDTQYSLLAGFAFALFYAVMGLPLARLADRTSRRGLIAAGIVVWSMMTALCGVAKGFWGLFFARVGVGVGEAALSPAAYSIISDYFPKGSLAKALSMFTVGVTIGSGLAYMIGGQVVAYVDALDSVMLPWLGETEGWQLTFFIVGLPGLLIAALMATVREPERRGRIVSPDAPEAAGVPLSTVVQFLRDRSVAIGTHVFGVALFILVVYGTNIWGPTYLIRTFDYEPARAGLIFGTAMLVFGTAGLMLGGIAADRWYSRGVQDAYSRVIIISALCMLPFMVSLAFIEQAPLGIAAISIATFFSAFQGGLSGGVLQLMTPNQMRGQLAAIYFFCSNLIGLGLGPTIVAATTDYVFGYDAAIGKSLALTGAIFIPLAVTIMLIGIRHVRKAIEGASEWHTEV